MNVFGRAFLVMVLFIAWQSSAMAQTGAKGWLGVQVGAVSQSDADAHGWESPRGAKVLKTVPGSPGEAAGLTPGDLLLSVDGTEIDDVQGFVALVSSKAPSTRIKLRLLRNQKEQVVLITLGSRTPDQATPESPSQTLERDSRCECSSCRCQRPYYPHLEQRL
jgi:S1-C subfamily serine protease